MASFPSTYSTPGRPRPPEVSSASSLDQDQCSSSVSSSSQPPTESVREVETVLLNPSHPSSPSLQAHVPTTGKSASAQSDGSIEGLSNQEPRKCWICYTDETEDTPVNSEWRSPCPCALTAHEACLLDWLADLEHSRTRKRNKMLCPQCKSEIVISRPRSFVVDFVRSMERLAGRLVLPGMVFTLAGTVWAGCRAHGVYSMYLVFGTEDARHIIETSGDGSWRPGLNLGLPLIPLVLIFSRTRYAEGLLPALPVLFLATHNPSGLEPIGGDLWPPSAAMTFAALPYVKSFYSAFYERIFGERERKWIAEVQPRAGEADSNAPQQGQAVAGQARRAAAALGEMGDGHIVMEIDLELQLGMEQDHDIPRDVPDIPMDENPQVVAGGQENQGAVGQQGQNQGQGQDRQILGRHREELIHDTSNLADTILGALLLPAISASVGGLLKLVLPRSWTTPPLSLDRGKVGLLQSRWGRSVVGGCLFVLLKDALVLYCRWKLAQTHRKRRVLNYDRTKKQVAER
ncbi:hypothetical protein V8E54_002531 [Elaphomyces granulatus]